MNDMMQMSFWFVRGHYYPIAVDAHRSTAFVVGPYVKKAALVSTHYTTVNMLRTITDVLGIDHLGINDASQGPMTDVFDLAQSSWTYTASASSLLKTTALPLPTTVLFAGATKATHDAKYWAAKTRKFDFSEEDKVDALAYNRVLWEGLMPGRPFTTGRAADTVDVADGARGAPTASRKSAHGTSRAAARSARDLDG